MRAITHMEKQSDNVGLVTVTFLFGVLPYSFFIQSYPSSIGIMGMFCLAIFVLYKPSVALLFLAFSTVITPEISIPSLVGIIPQKFTASGVTLSIDDFIIFPALLAMAIIVSVKQKHPWTIIPFRKPLLWIIIVTIAAFISGSLSLDSKAKLSLLLYTAKWIEYISIVLLVVFFIKIDHLKKFQRITSCLLLALLIASVFGIVEFFVSLATGSYRGWYYFPRVSSFWGHPLVPKLYGSSYDATDFGVYLMLMTSLSMGLLLYSKVKGMYKYFLIGCTISGLLCLIFTSSRTGIVSIVLPLMFLIRVRKIPLVLVVVLILTAIYLIFIQPKVPASLAFVDRYMPIYYAFTDSPYRGIDYSPTMRLYSMIHSPAYQISVYSILGHGYNSFRYIAESFAEHSPNTTTQSLYNFASAILYDTGIVGLITWTILLASIYKFLTKSIAQSQNSFMLGYTKGLRAGFIGLLFSSIFMETFYVWRIMGPFWFALGLLMVANRQQKSETPVTSPLRNSQQSFRFTRA